MLTKDMTPNPKAVNIIRPSSNILFSNPFSISSSASSNSSFLFQHNVSPIIRQSNDPNPGLSFFCQQKENIQNKIQIKEIEPVTVEQKPLVISRVNLPHRRSISPIEDVDLIHEQTRNNKRDSIIEPEEIEVEEEEIKVDNIEPEEIKPTSFKQPGFGIFGAGLGSFLLRGIQAKNSNLDEARVNRKIEDLEIEKKSLLSLNQTLETVVKQQVNTITDLQHRLATVERPLSPGLDTSTSKNGIMSNGEILESNDIVKYIEEEEEAFDRVRHMLLNLIDEAQTAVVENTNPPRRVVHHDQKRKVKSKRVISKRLSVDNHHNYSPSTSPIPNRRYSLQRSLSRSSSPTLYNSNVSTTSTKSSVKTKKTRPKSMYVSSSRKWLS